MGIRCPEPKALLSDVGCAGDPGGRGGARPGEEWNAAHSREGFSRLWAFRMLRLRTHTGKGLQVEGLAWEKLWSKES